MKQWFRNILRGLRGWLEVRGEKHVRAYESRLQSLPFFHSVHFGTDTHVCVGWKSSDSKFYSDAPVAVVVTRGDKVSGVVGFEVLGSTLLVRQLRGAPRGNFHDGTRVEAYLLECAEAIAEALEMRSLRIVTAETAISYRRLSPTYEQPSEKAELHMHKIYSYPAVAGYITRFCWRLRRPTFFRTLS